MRVIAGRFRSRKLMSVPGASVRPTPDRLRESLFSVLMPRIEGSIFVDAYAGSGSVGIEAISRGARRVIFIEQSRQALAVLQTNLDCLGIRDSEALVVRSRAALLIGNYSAGIIFIDPPYDYPSEYEDALTALGEKTSAPPDQLVIAQHASRLILADSYGQLRKIRVLRQGDNSLSFFERLDGRL